MLPVKLRTNFFVPFDTTYMTFCLFIHATTLV